MLKLNIMATLVFGAGLCTQNASAVLGGNDDGVNFDYVLNNAAFSLHSEVSSFRWRMNVHQTGGSSGLLLLWGNDTNDVIERILVTGRTGGSSSLFLLNISDGGDRADIGAIEEIDYSNSSEPNLRVSLIKITGDLGAPGAVNMIDTRKIDTIDILGDSYCQIVGSAAALTGPPASVLIGGDWIEGAYTNNAASIVNLIQVDGFVGSAGSPVSFWGAGTISEIKVGGDFYGRVGETGEGLSGHPDVLEMDIGGDFTGSGAMTVNSLSGLNIEDDFDADITITTAMANAAVLYDIGGSFVSTASMTLPADGLAGQVIINSGDTSDLWAGDVIVDGTTLGENYTELSSELGGGAIGLAPFNFHQRTSGPGSESRDCDPYHTEVLTASYDAGEKKNETIDEVRIRHYGPVYADGTDDHFVIEFKSDVLPSSWVDRSGLFVVKTASTVSDPGDCNIGYPCMATTAATAHRDAVIMKVGAFNPNGFTAAGRWRIRPNDAVGEGRIKCGDVNGNPDVEYETNAMVDGYYWYTFRVLLEAPGASGGSLLMGGTNASDLTSWVASPFEVNADGETDNQDFTELLESYTSN